MKIWPRFALLCFVSFCFVLFSPDWLETDRESRDKRLGYRVYVRRAELWTIQERRAIIVPTLSQSFLLVFFCPNFLELFHSTATATTTATILTLLVCV